MDGRKKKQNTHIKVRTGTKKTNRAKNQEVTHKFDSYSSHDKYEWS